MHNLHWSSNRRLRREVVVSNRRHNEWALVTHNDPYLQLLCLHVVLDLLICYHLCTEAILIPRIPFLHVLPSGDTLIRR